MIREKMASLEAVSEQDVEAAQARMVEIAQQKGD
jgi:flagellar motor switch protein FliG